AENSSPALQRNLDLFFLVSKAQVCSHLSLSQAHKNTLRVKTISSISICCFPNITITSLSAAAATLDRKVERSSAGRRESISSTFEPLW
uniref:Uncharacterized protein n=1 Tax=Cyanoderma ruficeps TaxID=181631 RepID=A0A8C3QIA2_9PASS